MELSALPAPCKTRWWTDLDLQCAFNKNSEFLAEFLTTYERGKHADLVPTLEDMKTIKAVIRARTGQTELETAFDVIYRGPLTSFMRNLSFSDNS